MEEVLNKIQQRETAAAKRERTLAYAFSHQARKHSVNNFNQGFHCHVDFVCSYFWWEQWRANSNQYFGQAYYDVSKESWGWSWKERWAAVRPWEKRYQMRPTLVKKIETTNSNTHPKPTLPNGQVLIQGKRLPKVSLNHNV